MKLTPEDWRARERIYDGLADQLAQASGCDENVPEERKQTLMLEKKFRKESQKCFEKWCEMVGYRIAT